jgi:O-methyltransferase
MSAICQMIKLLSLSKILQPRIPEFPSDFSEQDIEIIRSVKPYTMTSPERIYALIQSVKYLLNADIPGAIVECGVWRGGSMMAVAYTLLQCGKPERDLYLFDTFEGMTQPSNNDVSYLKESALDTFSRLKKGEDQADWCYASLQEVQTNLYNTGYPRDRLKFIKGKVEDSLPSLSPGVISLFRLDTDWYESTKHELIHLYPVLSPGGVLIIDDYGYWRGARKATDEYFNEKQTSVLLNRIDSTGRIAVKPGKGF